MKPARLTLTNELVFGYGLHNQIHNIYDVRSATREELSVYHDADYLDFLSRSDLPAFISTIPEHVCNG